MKNTVYVYKWIVNSEKWKISNTGSHQNEVRTRALASIKYYYLFVIHYSLKYYLVFYNFSLFIFHFFWKKVVASMMWWKLRLKRIWGLPVFVIHRLFSFAWCDVTRSVYVIRNNGPPLTKEAISVFRIIWWVSLSNRCDLIFLFGCKGNNFFR